MNGVAISAVYRSLRSIHMPRASRGRIGGTAKSSSHSSETITTARGAKLQAVIVEAGAMLTAQQEQYDLWKEGGRARSSSAHNKSR